MKNVSLPARDSVLIGNATYYHKPGGRPDPGDCCGVSARNDSCKRGIVAIRRPLLSTWVMGRHNPTLAPICKVLQAASSRRAEPPRAIAQFAKKSHKQVELGIIRRNLLRGFRPAPVKSHRLLSENDRARACSRSDLTHVKACARARNQTARRLSLRRQRPCAISDTIAGRLADSLRIHHGLPRSARFPRTA